jgi:hypothetical protein
VKRRLEEMMPSECNEEGREVGREDERRVGGWRMHGGTFHTAVYDF